MGVCDDVDKAGPGEQMVGQLERRVEAISGELNSQAVANTLWAYATGTKPGEQMVGQLERRVEAISGEFNSQPVANTTCVSIQRASQGTSGWSVEFDGTSHFWTSRRTEGVSKGQTFHDPDCLN